RPLLLFRRRRRRISLQDHCTAPCPVWFSGLASPLSKGRSTLILRRNPPRGSADRERPLIGVNPIHSPWSQRRRRDERRRTFARGAPASRRRRAHGDGAPAFAKVKASFVMAPRPPRRRPGLSSWR